ncbi:class I SAM-dependent methyltransferase [Dokdonella sp.]|uniref:class I SAM-dependent methyltransferase n=1 Tax=Dokdonella sp. TaxID=2291710 RepID=UPI001B01E64B|nr:class I SAM-dependent methyltransferase [Dokdonella sp.]MBO9663454.1 class I SAM-dependent methyltransferase [Dokdonella sp.]
MPEQQPRAVARRIADRFPRRWHRDYVRSKLRFDPAYAAVAAVVAEDASPLLDIGCGLGLLGFYLRESGFAAGYRGIDFDGEKIAIARAISARHSLDLAFDDGDAGELPPFSGHVALLDVLHYLPAAAQQRLLRDAAARVAPGAALILRNVLRERGWRFRLTVWEEYFLYASRWMRSPAVHYPERGEIETPLRAAGLEPDVRPLWGSTPFNSFVIVARRPPGAAVSRSP